MIFKSLQGFVGNAIGYEGKLHEEKQPIKASILSKKAII